MSTRRPHVPRACGEYRAGGMGVREDQRAASRPGAGEIARIVRALMRLAAACGRFDRTSARVGPQRRADSFVAHGGRSARAAAVPSASRIALQNGSSRSPSVGQCRSRRSFRVRGRPSTVLNQICGVALELLLLARLLPVRDHARGGLNDRRPSSPAPASRSGDACEGLVCRCRDDRRACAAGCRSSPVGSVRSCLELGIIEEAPMMLSSMQPAFQRKAVGRGRLPQFGPAVRILALVVREAGETQAAFSSAFRTPSVLLVAAAVAHMDAVLRRGSVRARFEQRKAEAAPPLRLRRRWLAAQGRCRGRCAALGDLLAVEGADGACVVDVPESPL